LEVRVGGAPANLCERQTHAKKLAVDRRTDLSASEEILPARRKDEEYQWKGRWRWRGSGEERRAWGRVNRGGKGCKNGWKGAGKGGKMVLGDREYLAGERRLVEILIEARIDWLDQKTADQRRTDGQITQSKR
jgi:hypothetical protein